MRDVAFERGTALRLASVSSGAVRVNLDGCLSSDSAVNCRGNDSILVHRGPEPSAQEHGLQPFTGSVGGSIHVTCHPPPPPPRPAPSCQPLPLTNLLLLLLPLSM